MSRALQPIPRRRLRSVLRPVQSEGLEKWTVRNEKQESLLVAGAVFMPVPTPVRHHEVVALLPFENDVIDRGLAAAAHHVENSHRGLPLHRRFLAANEHARAASDRRQSGPAVATLVFHD